MQSDLSLRWAHVILMDFVGLRLKSLFCRQPTALGFWTMHCQFFALQDESPNSIYYISIFFASVFNMCNTTSDRPTTVVVLSVISEINVHYTAVLLQIRSLIIVRALKL